MIDLAKFVNGHYVAGHLIDLNRLVKPDGRFSQSCHYAPVSYRQKIPHFIFMSRFRNQLGKLCR